MKQINPLYIAILLVLLLIMAIVRLNQAKDAQYEATLNLQNTKAMAERITSLKQNWDDPKKADAALNRILKSSQLASSKLEQKKSPGMAVLSAKSMDLGSVNYLTNKLFNGAFSIKAIKVRHLEGERYTFYAEVAL